jgi:hypothetical protein
MALVSSFCFGSIVKIHNYTLYTILPFSPIQCLLLALYKLMAGSRVSACVGRARVALELHRAVVLLVGLLVLLLVPQQKHAGTHRIPRAQRGGGRIRQNLPTDCHNHVFWLVWPVEHLLAQSEFLYPSELGFLREVAFPCPFWPLPQAYHLLLRHPLGIRSTFHTQVYSQNKRTIIGKWGTTVGIGNAARAY